MGRIIGLRDWLKWILAAVGAAALHKAEAIRSTRVDGSGIGLYVLGIEITDRLPNEQIPRAAFDLIGLVASLTALGLHVITVWRRWAD